MKKREVSILALVLGYPFAILWPGLVYFLVYHYQYDPTGKWWVLLVALAPGGIVTVLHKYLDTRERRTREEERQAERRAELDLHLEGERLREEEEAQDRLKEAQAFQEEAERSYTERPRLEPFVVGDERFGVRSPYKVEMNPAETALLNTISSRFDPACLFVDTYLDKGDGTTAQIDIIAVCRQGIIVVESKGSGGRISGKVGDRYWKHEQSQEPIYSPIWQNRSHVESLCRVLDRVLGRVLESAEAREDLDDIPF